MLLFMYILCAYELGTVVWLYVAYPRLNDWTHLQWALHS